ncbi:amidohydrolase family protein, partial [Streptomyces sp. DSM 41534]
MRDPDRAEIDRLLAAAAGTIRMVTIAPERPGALEAIRQFVDAGVVVAVGHTEATYEQTRSAIAAGATVGTHLFNAMRPIDRREPGPVIALMEDPSVTVELIADGVHLDPAVYRHVCRSVGPDRVSLITDAMAATGMPDGRYH